MRIKLSSSVSIDDARGRGEILAGIIQRVTLSRRRSIAAAKLSDMT